MKQTKRQAKNAEEFAKWLEEHLPHISMKNKEEYRNVKTPISFVCAEHGGIYCTTRCSKTSKTRL